MYEDGLIACTILVGILILPTFLKEGTNCLNRTIIESLWQKTFCSGECSICSNVEACCHIVISYQLVKVGPPLRPTGVPKGQNYLISPHISEATAKLGWYSIRKLELAYGGIKVFQETLDFIKDELGGVYETDQGVRGGAGVWELHDQSMAMTRTPTVGTAGNRNICGSGVRYQYTPKQVKIGHQGMWQVRLTQPGCGRRGYSRVAKSDFQSRVMIVAFGAGVHRTHQWQGSGSRQWQSNGERMKKKYRGEL
ncbi:hypothetical protein EDC04DRAFT_2605181 [Pisolithus marmoratus]|nr:hypothetical protein EDC04DRAFT_2605181 [Pisolithus marmoratus]